MKRSFPNALTTLVLAAALLLPAVAQASDATAAIVTVSGRGTVQEAPDEAVVRLGVQSEAPEASDAQAGASRVATAILEALKTLGVEADAVQTSRLQLFPLYEPRRQGPAQGQQPRIIGYSATNTVAVTLSDLDRIGPVVDRAIAAGANRVESVDFRLRDDSHARQSALKAAVRDAREKALTIAEALGETLGAILEVNEGGVSAPPIVYRESAMLAADAPTPISAGRLGVTATVTLRYRLGSTPD